MLPRLRALLRKFKKFGLTTMTTQQSGDAIAISFRRLSKSYADTPVLQQLELEVPAGRTFGLVGMNGAGKTTLIKCLLDFCEFDSGDIRIFGLPSRITRAAPGWHSCRSGSCPPITSPGRISCAT